MQFKTEIQNLKRKNILLKFPNETAEWVQRIWYDSSIKYTKGNTASRIEKNIISYIKLTGHQAEKRAVMGREIITPDVKTSLGTLRGKRIRIPSTGTKGASDVSAVLYGIAISIEIKRGGDTQKSDQKKYQDSIVAAGGFYFIAHDEDDFLIKWNQLLEHPKIILMSQF